MRLRVANRKLGRKTEHRISLLRNLCTSLIVHERLITTLPKAKELRPFAERAITLGKRALLSEAPEDALHARRRAARFFHHGNVNRVPDGGYKRPRAPRTAGVQALDKLFQDIAGRFVDRPGGYTRILKLGARKGDGAEMALIELVGSEEKPAHREEKKEQKRRRFFRREKKPDKVEAADSKATAEGTEEKPSGRAARTKSSSKTGASRKAKSGESKTASKPRRRAGKKEEGG
jgi:large subunit ribosomal protein L17